MDLSEANKIKDAYRECIAKGTVGETILRKASWLPFSRARIKYAYFILLEDIVEKEGRLPDDLREKFVEEYSTLSFFVDDATVDKYSTNYKDWQSKKSDPFKNKKDEVLIKQYIAYTHMLRSGGALDEINEYIEELIRQK